MDPEQMFNILAFGDSLTQGYSRHGTAFFPYSATLERMLNESRRNNRQYRVENVSRPGYTTEEMLLHLEEIFEKTPQRYRSVIILGGSSDLARANPERISDNLMMLHEECKKAGARSFAVTIPENFQESRNESVRRVRHRVNQQLADFCRKMGIPLIDINERLPRASLTPAEIEQIWDDEVHLTEYGYKQLAEIIFDSMQKYL